MREGPSLGIVRAGSLAGRRRRSEKSSRRGQFLPGLQRHNRNYGAKSRWKMDRRGRFAADVPSAAQTPGAEAYRAALLKTYWRAL